VPLELQRLTQKAVRDASDGTPTDDMQIMQEQRELNRERQLAMMERARSKGGSGGGRKKKKR
jgi:DNA invertase Pin-like site-specific DNA recombinase